jgi:hypothetical protein
MLQILREYNDFCAVRLTRIREPNSFGEVQRKLQRFSTRTGPRLAAFRLLGDFLYRVMVMFFSAAIRSASGGCVLKSPESVCPIESGATIIRAEVVGEIFMGICLL